MADQFAQGSEVAEGPYWTGHVAQLDDLDAACLKLAGKDTAPTRQDHDVVTRILQCRSQVADVNLRPA
jgi:hypothetical protein